MIRLQTAPPRGDDWSFPAIITGTVPPDPNLPPNPNGFPYIYTWEPALPNFEMHPTYVVISTPSPIPGQRPTCTMSIDIKGTAAFNMEEWFGYSRELFTFEVPAGTPVIMNVGYPPSEIKPGPCGSGGGGTGGAIALTPILSCAQVALVEPLGGNQDANLALCNVWIWFKHWVDPASERCTPFGPLP